MMRNVLQSKVMWFLFAAGCALALAFAIGANTGAVSAHSVTPTKYAMHVVVKSMSHNRYDNNNRHHNVYNNHNRNLYNFRMFNYGYNFNYRMSNFSYNFNHRMSNYLYRDCNHRYLSGGYGNYGY